MLEIIDKINDVLQAYPYIYMGIGPKDEVKLFGQLEDMLEILVEVMESKIKEARCN